VCPKRVSACETHRPDSIETSRSLLEPPITTATLDIRYEFSDEMHFEVKIRAKRIEHGAMNPRQEDADIARGRPAHIDDEVGMPK
jgi:hypothetical protein